MKNIFILLCALSIVACKQEPKDYVTFSGKIINQNSDSLLIGTRTYTKTIKVNSDGTFKDTLKISEPGVFALYDGKASTPLFLRNGFEINMEVDTEEFDQTIKFSGIGSEHNNFLAEQKLLQENEKQYADLLKILKLQYDKGVIKKMDYDRTRVAYNNITSQLVLLETNKKLALNQLKVSIGMPMSESITIDESIEVEMDITPPMSSTVDVSQRIDYKIQEQAIILKSIQVKGMKYVGLPSLGAYARYGANAYGNDFGESFNKWFDYSAIGVKLTVPIFNGTSAFSNYKIGQLDLMNMQENAKINIQNFQLESENANTQLMSSYTSLITNKENMQLAKEVHEASNLEYKEGTSSLTDLLNSDYSYKEAQSNYINSLLNYLTSKMQYEKSKGTLNEYVNQLK